MIHKKIDYSFFFRSLNVVENLYIEDLKSYLTGNLIFSDDYQNQTGSTYQSYFTYGLLNAHIVKKNNAVIKVHKESELRFHYAYSAFGLKFIKACKEFS